MKKLLVIGGTGYIGYNCLKKASKLKMSLTSISLNIPEKNKRIKNVKYYNCDLTKMRRLKKIKNKYDYVINVSGYYHKANNDIMLKHYTGIKNIVNFLDKKKLKKFIHIGTSLEYGDLRSPLKESMICKPKSYYGKIKLKCTKYLLKTHKEKFYPITILRLFSLYGLDYNKGLMFKIIKLASQNKNYKLSSSHYKRDFCHIQDIIGAIFKTLFSSNTDGEIFNVGYGKPFTIRKVADLISKKINFGKPIWTSSKLNNSIINFYPNTIKIRNIIKWKPKISFINGVNNLIKQTGNT